MRIHKLLATALVALLLLPGCQQEEDYVLPSIELGTNYLDFSDDTSLKINVTATRDWQVRSKPDWVAVDPDHGTRSSTPQRVLISVLPNSEYNRTGEILFTIGLAKAAVEVKQLGEKGEKPRGSGTKEDPYTVGGAVEFISGLAADTPTTDNVYIKGKISQITEEFSAQYGNGTFYIADEEGTSFYVFRTMYLGNKKWTANDTQIKVGDEVIVCGQVVNYKGNTPETVNNKSYLYSLNGKVVEPDSGGGGGGGGTGTPSGTGTLADPYNPAGANAYINTLADNAKSDKDIYVKGKISKIANNGEFSASYGNASFYITEDGSTGGADFYCYRVLYLGNKKWATGDTQIKVGDEVVICGKVTKYVSSYGTTPETSGNEAYVYSLNGVTGGSGSGGGSGTGTGTTPGTTPATGTPSGAGTLASPYNVAAAINAVKDLTWTSNTEYQKTEEVYVKGKICEIASKGTYGESGEYGNASFYISDDGTTSGSKFYVFRALYLKNAKYTSGTDIKVGDDVIICGKLMNYKGNTPETVANENYLYSLNGKTE